MRKITFFQFVILAFLTLGAWNSQVWGNTVSSANSSDDVQNGKIVMNGNHATFTFAASGTTISRGLTAYNLGSIDHGGTKTCTFTWSANSGCSIKVTKIEFGVRGYTSNIGRTGEMQATFNGETKSIGSIVTTLTNFSATNNNGFSSGIQLTLKNTCGGHGLIKKTYDSFDYYLNDISITYTITPNAPTISATTATVNVSLGEENKLDMTTVIGVSDVDDFMPVSFGSNSFSDPQGVSTTGAYTFTGKNFYATKAGVYTFNNPYIAAKSNCHEKSASTTGSITITVNRLAQALTMKNGSVNVTTDKANPTTLDLSTLINSHTGNGAVTYSLVSGPKGETTGNIDGNNFYAWVGGTYTLRATAAKTAQYNAVTSSDFTVTVNRLTQTISWTPANLETEPFVEDDEISVTSIGALTLAKSGTGAEYISIDGDKFVVNEVGAASEVTLTATAAQTDVYAQATDSKTISLTSLAKQHITFDQVLTKLKTTDGTKKVELKATSDSSRDSYITFEVSSNSAGVTVTHEGDKWYLNYSATVAKGIMVTARLDGVANEYVAASPVSQMVKVIDPTAVCDVDESLATASGLANTSKYYDLTIPKKVVLKVRSSKSKLYTNSYEIKFYDKNNNEISTGQTQSWTGRSWDQTVDTRTFNNLDKSITRMEFKSNASNGFDITEASYERWSYITPSVSELNYEAYALSTAEDQTFTIDYANYQIELAIEESSNFVLKSEDSFGDCETSGTKTVKVGYNVPAEKCEETAYLRIKDNTGTLHKTITLHANVLGGLTQNITSHNIKTSYLTTDLVNLTATTDRNMTNFTYSATPADVAVFDGAQMTFKKNGTIAITVTEAGNATFAEASTTVNNVVVSKVTPTITNPDVAVIHYLDNFSNSQLSNGLATVTLRGVDNTPVAGTFTWTTLNNTLVTDKPGSHDYSVTFTPTDLGMYNPVTFTMPVTISRALVPVLEMNGTTVDVSRIVPEQDIDHKKTVNLTSLVAQLPAEGKHPMNPQDFTYAVTSVNTTGDSFTGSTATAETAHIDNTAKTFYATEVGTYTITVTSPQTEWYEQRQVDFDITVNKLQPSVYFSAEDTVYRVRYVKNAAVCICEGETIPTPVIRYTSTKEDIIHEIQDINGNYNLVSNLADDAVPTTTVITANFYGNAYFLPVTGDKEYLARAKYQPRFFINLTEEQNHALKVGESAQATFEYCLLNDNNFQLYHSISPSDIITYDPVTQRVTAVGSGIATITFTQPADGDRFMGTRDFTFTVTKNETGITLADQVTNGAMYVGDVLSGTLYTANTDEVPITITSSNDAVITCQDGQIVALSEGDATLTFAMIPEGTPALKWDQYSITQTIHVSKRANTLTPNYSGVTKSYGGSETIVITASNTDYENSPVTLEAVSNGDLVSITRIDNNSFRITALHEEGTATLRATQAANNEYVAPAPVDITFTVGKSNYHVPVTYSNALFNDTYFTTDKYAKCSFIGHTGEDKYSMSGNTLTLGDPTWGGLDYDDKYVILHFEGVPDKLTFTHNTKSNQLGVFSESTDIEWYVQESATNSFSGKTWTSSNASEDPVSITVQLRPGTRYIKLCYSGNYAGQFKNIQFSERMELAAADPATTAASPYTFESKALGTDDSEQQFIMDWYNIAEVRVTSSDNHFSVAPASFADFETYGQQAVTVVYHRSMDIGVHTATITVSNGTQTQYIYVKGETTKKTATISWHKDIEACNFLMNPDEVYPAGAVDYVATVSNGGDCTISSDNESVISVNNNILTAHTTGTANITVSYAGSGDFYPASVTKQFTVTTATKQTINWQQNLMTLRLGDGSLTLDATASSGKPVTYTLADNGIVSVDGSVLQVDAAGDTYITATQAGGTFGGITYAPVSMTKRVHVGNPSVQCEDYALLNGACTFAALQQSAGIVFVLDGPAGNRVYFDACHDKFSGNWGLLKNYGPLVVEEYRYNNNTWEWHEIFNQVVNNETAANYSATVDPTTTRLRFYSNEEVTHHVSGITLRRAKSLTASETAVNAEADCNVLYTKTIRVNYSGLDVLTASVTGGFSLDKQTVGNGCGTYGTEEITVSLTPSELKTYNGTLAITDGKTNETRIEIPLSLVAQPVSQTIIDFNPAATIHTTDHVTLSANVLSGNPVYFTSSDESVATVNSEGNMTILKAGTVIVTAHCDAIGVYAAAPDVAKTIVINKVTPEVVTAPVAGNIMVPATMESAAIDASSAVVRDDKGTIVYGTFAWQDMSYAPAAGESSYAIVFTPDNADWYNPVVTDIPLVVELRPQRIDWQLPDNSAFYCFESLTLNVASVDALTADTVLRRLSYTSSDPAVATVNEVGKIIINQPGTVTITASANATGLYNAADDVQRTISFTKATPVIVRKPKATPISKEQRLSKSYFYDYEVRVPEFKYNIPGSFVWETPDYVQNEAGTFNFNARFVPTNMEYFEEITCNDIAIRIVSSFWTFVNPDNHDWEDRTNWSNTGVPTETNPDITVEGGLHIASDKEISSMLIDSTGSVTITNGADVTIINHSSFSESGKYGDLIVENGKLTLNAPVNVRNFIISSRPSDTDGVGYSGQIVNVENLNIVDGDIYYEVEITPADPSGHIDEDQWYAFAVPFPVSIKHGDVARLENIGGVEQWNYDLGYYDNYAIAKYISQRRANYGKGWQQHRDSILLPGNFYMLGIDNQATRYRFRKVTGAPLVSDESVPTRTYTYNGNATEERKTNETDENWNAIANPNLIYSKTANYDYVRFAYILLNGAYNYKLIDLEAETLPVGTPFAVQVPSRGSVTVSPVTQGTSPVAARRNAPAEVKDCEVVFAPADNAKKSDHVFISASEDATDNYEIGKDLVKLKANTPAPQMWINAYDKHLAVNNAYLFGSEAVFPVTLSAPADGDYTLSMGSAPDNAEVYLLYNGRPIWNLAVAPCTISLNKGIAEGYSLLLHATPARIVTGLDDTDSQDTQTQKLIRNGVLYILRDGILYDATGRKTGNN